MVRDGTHEGKGDDHDIAAGRERHGEREDPAAHVLTEHALEEERGDELAALLDLLHGHDCEIGEVGQQVQEARRDEGRQGHRLQRPHGVLHLVQHVVEVRQAGVRVEDFEERGADGAEAPVAPLPQAVPAIEGHGRRRLPVPEAGARWPEDHDVQG